MRLAFTHRNGDNKNFLFFDSRRLSPFRLDWNHRRRDTLAWGMPSNFSARPMRAPTDSCIDEWIAGR